MFFISADCLNAFSRRRRWGSEAAEPEFQVEREGQRERREGRRSRRYKRCSVFTGKRERDEGRVATV